MIIADKLFFDTGEVNVQLHPVPFGSNAQGIDISVLIQGIIPAHIDEEQTSDSIILEEQDDSNQSGTVMLGESDGKATVSVRILGSSEKAQSAHIHNGSCAYPGAVKYPLTTLADGSSKTTLDISQQQLLWGLPLAVIVHASATDETVVACGDLSY